jgi:hypothetical protein
MIIIKMPTFVYIAFKRMIFHNPSYPTLPLIVYFGLIIDEL